MAQPTSLLSSEEYSQLLSLKLNTSDFQIVSIDETTPSQRAGFLGDHHFIKIVVETRDPQSGKDVLKELALFAKSLPSNVNCRLMVEDSSVFEKEAAFYNSVAKDFDSVLGQALNYPPPVLVRSDMVLLEDMRVHGYKPMASVTKAVDRPHLEQALAALARFHSASIAAERMRKATLKQLYPEALTETTYSMQGRFGKFNEVGFRAMRSLIPLLPQYENQPSAAREIQEKFRVDGFGKFLKEFTERNSDTVSVFCHGDAWISNFIFKYDENEQPVQALLLDFQITRYAPPASDVAHLLVMSLGHDDDREQQMLDLQAFYYTCLGEELRQRTHGSDNELIDVERVLPRDAFMRSCKTYAVLSAVMKALFSHMIDAPPAFVGGLYSPTDTAPFEQYVLTDRADKCKELFQSDTHFREATTRNMTEVLAHLARGEIL